MQVVKTETVKSMITTSSIIDGLKIIAKENTDLAIKVITDLSGYDNKAAEIYLDTFVLNKVVKKEVKKDFKCAIVTGNNKTRYGDTRYWTDAKCTSSQRKNKRGQLLIEVVDPISEYKTRWLNLSSFNGTITFKNDSVEHYEKGAMTISNMNKNSYQKVEIKHYFQMVKEYFNMNHEQWQVFLKAATKESIMEVVNSVKKERN